MSDMQNHDSEYSKPERLSSTAPVSIARFATGPAVGAALEVAIPVGIPHEVTLNILTRKVRQHCYIVWRKEKRIGLAFD